MYKIILSATGEMLSFCLTEDALVESATYLDPPEDFDPNINTCKMVEGKLVLQSLTAMVIDTREKMIQKVMLAYQNHTINGVNYFERMRAELVLGYKMKQMTLEQCIGIEASLKSVKSVVITGDWLTALEISKTLVPSAILSQALIDRIKNDIANYISTNY
jgi:hypothetical protein